MAPPRSYLRVALVLLAVGVQLELVYLVSDDASLELLGPALCAGWLFRIPSACRDRFRPESAPSPDPLPTLKEPAENIDS